MTTMSALPIAPGVTKLMGVEGARDVKLFVRSHVVCHWKARQLTDIPSGVVSTNNIPNLLRGDHRRKEQRGHEEEMHVGEWMASRGGRVFIPGKLEDLPEAFGDEAHCLDIICPQDLHMPYGRTSVETT